MSTVSLWWNRNKWAEADITNSRGGPAEMLKVSKPRQLAEGVTMSPARLMLEILAIYETFGKYPYQHDRVFGSFTDGQVALLLDKSLA